MRQRRVEELIARATRCILVTAGIRHAVREVSGISLRPLGAQNLKNISEPTEVFAEIEETYRAEAILAAGPACPSEQPQLEPFPATPTSPCSRLPILSGDPRNDHLCEGIAEDIIANLTGFATHGDRAPFRFPVQPQRHARRNGKVQRRLGNRYILSGSLRRGSKRLASRSS